MTNIPGIVAQAGIQLEAQALNTFGAVVGNQANSVLASAFAYADSTLGINTAQIASALSEPSIWDPTPYASALASGVGGYDPKLKFLFKVTFRFIPDVASEIASLLGISSTRNFAADITFTVKRIDLPKYRFEYDEVNMYNFRTQVLRRIMHDELSFQMYDSTGNHAANFINAYLQLLMPQSRQPYTTGYDLWDHGFAFTGSPAQGNDTGVRAVLGSTGQSVNILDVMIIDQFYLARTPSDGFQGTGVVNAIKANSFVFTNPKLTNFDLGDQDHERGSEPNFISCGFVYDTLYIQNNQLGADVANERPALAGYDLLSGAEAGANSLIGGGGGNPYLSMQGGLTSVAGILAQAGLNSVGGGAATPLIPIVADLGTNAARTLASLGSTAPGITPTSQPILSDNSTPASQINILSSQTANNQYDV